MKLVNKIRQYHKWMMLFLGTQFVIWSVTGTYMVVIDLNYIHGNNLIKEHQPNIDSEDVKFTLTDILALYPGATDIELATLAGQTVYHVINGKQQLLLSALTGERLAPFGEKRATEISNYYYSGTSAVKEINLITQNPPYGLNKKFLPAYRIDYDAFSSPSIYISAESGKLVRYRHNFWRIFDWMFRFHLADYNNREHDNWLLFWLTLFSIGACLLGLGLSYFTVLRKAKEA
ncbi:hypothetical protein [Paraglaciecola polaris]|uniref:PepSY-associated TM helix n=1 Tax=Paraglaciecola polaris LMG 21857 TaxID=1129793 RepID=K6ZQH2_9ALTE|nr:hypothetical protein [Paraglaciecola polaris]GAC31123.1 hypothetical protein GPLA_0204 [Paraglaciecola polaris LMG 21857]|tara:strand:+ start:2161 stop:2856 length:696 start_codon:yes stop_codon:yes gene_type:complete